MTGRGLFHPMSPPLKKTSPVDLESVMLNLLQTPRQHVLREPTVESRGIVPVLSSGRFGSKGCG